MVWHSFCVLIATAVISFVSPASAEGLPTNVCAEEFCSKPQKKIWQRFSSAREFDQSRIPGVYSGICYYGGLYVPPDAPQFAGIFISSSENRFHFDGRFSFFEKYNPYDALTLASAREQFPKKHALKLEASFAYSNLSGKFVPIHYWMRHDPKSDELLVVGYFGFRKTFLCALDRHI